jgi:hypothetical protein
MKKLLFLIACTYGMSTHAMESSSSAYLNFKALIDHSPSTIEQNKIPFNLLTQDEIMKLVKIAEQKRDDQLKQHEEYTKTPSYPKRFSPALKEAMRFSTIIDWLQQK